MARKRREEHPDQLALNLDFLFGASGEHPPADPKPDNPTPVTSSRREGDDSEPVRPAGDAALARHEARPGPGPGGPGGVLHADGRGSGAGDRATRADVGRGSAAAGDLTAASPAAHDGPVRGGEPDSARHAADHRVAGPPADTPAPPRPPSSRPPSPAPPPSSGPPRFRPTGQHDLAPSGEVERIRANLDAVRALARQQQQQRPATADEQELYARWSGWGATPALFDERPKYAGRFAAERAELQALLGEAGY